jgi:hypothetical protein
MAECYQENEKLAYTIEEKYLQITHLIRSWYPEYIKNY